MPESLQDQIDILKKRCKCNIKIVQVEDVVPDVTQTNTIQVLTNGEVWFVACAGTTVLLQSTAQEPVTLSADATTQESANLSGQELQLVPATTTTAGVMSAADKLKLDGLVNSPGEHFGVNIDEGGVVPTGYVGRLVVPYAGTITGWTILEMSEVPITGDVVVTVSKGTYADYDTTPIFAAISGTEKPTISGNVKGQDLALSTWTTAVAAGDILQFSVDSAATVEKVYVSVLIQRT